MTSYHQDQKPLQPVKTSQFNYLEKHNQTFILYFKKNLAKEL